MNKAIIIIPTILLLGAVVLLLVNSLSEPAIVLPELPDIEGKIYAISEQRILVAEGFEGEEYDGSIEKLQGNAIWFTIDQATEIMRESGEALSFSDLAAGQTVKAWSTGLILESYPAQTTAAKIVLLEKPEIQCFIGGCSSELCTSDPEAMSTCEELPGTACLQKEGVSCELVAGKCQWVLSAQAAECFLDIEQQYGKEATETRIKHLFEKAREF